MTSRQCEIAAEAYAASLLAQAGFDVSVQYGAHQPNYDLIANKGSLFVPVSVKGSQDGGWMLAVKYKKAGNSYHDAINLWLAAQRPDVLFMFIQFIGVAVGELPRAYIARPPEIAAHLKTECSGRGHGSLQEDYRRDVPGSKYDHKIPAEWDFSEARFEAIAV